MALVKLGVKRVYDEATAADGVRVLVDRLWPRGLSREQARIDAWKKELGPSHELRRWFGHDPSRWDGFQERYARELRGRRQELTELLALAAEGRHLTLLFAARDPEHNQAVALMHFLVSTKRAKR